MIHRSRATGFNDLLFNLLVGITCLFVLSFLMIAEEKIKVDSNVKTQAEYIITVVWPDGGIDDVDTWLMDPRGKKLAYINKNIGTAHLDRDDLGKASDYITDANGNKIEYVHNQEITTIRVPMEGEWVLNLHMFHKRNNIPTTVEVKMDKLNPTVKTMFLQKITMKRHWEEITVARFQMSKLGEILYWDELPKKIVSIDQVYMGAVRSQGDWTP